VTEGTVAIYEKAAVRRAFLQSMDHGKPQEIVNLATEREEVPPAIER